MTAHYTTAHSAEVRLQLEAGGQVFEIAQIGPEDLILVEPINLAPCDACVVMHVDGRERRWRVRLPIGASADNPSVATIQYD